MEFKSINENDLLKAEIGKGYFLLCNDVNAALTYAIIKEEKIVAEGFDPEYDSPDDWNWDKLTYWYLDGGYEPSCISIFEVK